MKQQDITLRQAVLEDAQHLANFNSAMALETESIELIPEVILKGVKSLISKPHHGFYLVAEVEGCIVASLMITTEWSDWRNGFFWWIQSVYVVAEWRRKGLYSKLYEEVKSLAQQHDDVCGYRLYVEHDNNVAQQAYQYLGMEETRYKLFEEMDSSIDFKK